MHSRLAIPASFRSLPLDDLTHIHRSVSLDNPFDSNLEEYENKPPEVLVSQAHEDIMVHGIEELGEVKVHDMVVAHVGLGESHLIFCTPVRPVAETKVRECRPEHLVFSKDGYFSMPVGNVI